MASISPETSDLAIKTMDPNRYATKKTIAQGMLDIALLTSNASQLKYILQSENHQFYHFMLVMISISIILQIIVGAIGIGLIFYNPTSKLTRNRANIACLIMAAFAFFVAQGAIAIFLGSVDINKEEHHKKANLAQNAALIMNLVSVIVNIMINTMEIKTMSNNSGAIHDKFL